MEKNIKVLIVDDDVVIGETLFDIFDMKGIKTVFVDSGRKALEAVRAINFDFVLMDIKMPVMNGIETFKEIKKIRPDAVVIMMTGFSVDELIAEALEEGAYEVLRKPLDIDRLIRIFERAKNGVLVMIVDDDQEICATLKDILEIKGISLSVFHSGEEAIRNMKEKSYDVIFIDVKLPRMNGVETFLEIKKIDPNVKVVMVTGYDEEYNSYVKSAKAENVYKFLCKPLDPEIVLRIIEEIDKEKNRS